MTDRRTFRAASLADIAERTPETTVKPPIGPLPPKEEWATHGDPRITEWCDTCKCRVVTNDHGECLWCCYKVDRRFSPRPWASRIDVAPFQKGSLRLQVLEWFGENGPACVTDVSKAMGSEGRQAAWALGELRSKGYVDRLRRVANPDGGGSYVVYGISVRGRRALSEMRQERAA